MLRQRRVRVLPAVPVAAGVVVALLGCSGAVEAPPEARSSASERRPPSWSASPPASPAPEIPAPETSAPSAPAPRGPAPGARPRTALLSLPAIGVADLRIVPYEGTTDDWPGTRIQNGGVGASPYGERGGVGPGQVGNYLVTAHRLSAGGPLRRLPELDEGDAILVRAGGTVHRYEVSDTRETSFRSRRSLAEQRAAVPGFPDRRPTRPVITISTCATPEDNAAGNFWRDAKGNPEHRIDKIGVLADPGAGS